MLFSLNLDRTETETFVRSQFQLLIYGLPEVNQRLEFVDLYVLKILGLVINDYPGLGVDKLVDNAQKVVKAVYFLEKCLVVRPIFVQKIVGKDIG